MAEIKKIKENVHFVGALHKDRKLFDELIPLPDGTSYNSYLIRGSEKIALIDTVDPEKTVDLMKNLDSLNIEKIDFIIANHAEQDHSGSIHKVLERYPNAVVICNQKCKEMLVNHINLSEDKVQVIEDNEELSLGDKTLQFIFTPWVHWPETMCTYLIEDKILFSCDFFGAHIASDELFVIDNKKIYTAAKRYFAEIMMPFRTPINSNLEKLKNYEIKIIAPSHGQVYDNPKMIIDAYYEWIADETKKLVVLAYVSMHESTKNAIEHLGNKLKEKNIDVKIFNLSSADIGEVAIELVDAHTLVIGSPAYLVGPHPKVMDFAYIINGFRPKTKFISFVCSFGWGCRVIDKLKDTLSNLKAQVIEPVQIKGLMKEKDKNEIEKLAEEIVNKLDGD